MKEAAARIKINKLLENAGWRFFADAKGPANIQLEPSVTLKAQDLDALGENFEKAIKGFIDFLLLNEKGFPFIVLEAKAEDKNPLVGKEQARKYAKSQNCRFVILSNGNLHYFWDLERGNPYVITAIPTPTSITGYQKTTPNPERLIEEVVGDDYVVLTHRPGYATEAAWKNEAERPGFIVLNGLRFLRLYQKKAIFAIQSAIARGLDRFLLEMATGTGKTLVAAAIIKLFLRTGNARRVLFLVDRLELEEQALKAFKKVLANDYKTVIYKENRDDWRHAEIVVTTVQSLLFNNKYQQLFSPTDFDLVISDEAHRSIGGNARAVFDFFIGYKLGLTATPRDYLKKFEKHQPTTRDPREFERRLLLDTYRTFGCDDGQPTFRYSLLEGVKDGFLINPTVVDARSEVTTQLLSDDGFVIEFKDDDGEDQKETYKQREFEKRFFSPATNQLLCKTLLENALRDPISGEIGKSIVFAVSQKHAADLTQIFNQMADRMFYEKFEDAVRENDFIAASVEAGQWDRVIDYVNKEVFDKPAEFYTLDKLRKAAAVDRRLTLREILEKIFGLIPRFKSKDELLEEEFSKFVADYKPEEAEAIPAIKTYFKAYVTDGRIRHIIDEKEFADLATNPVFSTKDFKAVPAKYPALIPEYIKDYVSLNQFAA